MKKYVFSGIALDDTGTVIGCIGLQFCWNDLAEIKSLAVREDYHGQGIGRRLVEHCLAEAREFGARKVFALTFVPDFLKISVLYPYQRMTCRIKCGVNVLTASTFRTAMKKPLK